MAQQILSTNTFTVSKFVVSATATEGNYTTIQAAITAASSGDTVYIRDGTFTENLTLKDGVNLSSLPSSSSLNGTAKTIISGTCTMTTAGSVTISGIQLQTNSAALLAITGSAASVVNLENCYLNMTNSSGITLSSSDATSAININKCSGNVGTTGIKIFAHTGAGSLNSQFWVMANSGASTTASTITSGTLNTGWSVFASPITGSSTATILGFFTQYNTAAQNVIPLIAGGTALTLNKCDLVGGTAQALTVTTAGGTVTDCTITSSNTNAIDGAGTINYTNLAFNSTSQKISTTTQAGGTIKGGQTQAPSAGFLGEQIRSAVATISMSTTGTVNNITSISLTAGIWDVSGNAECVFSVGTSVAWGVSVNTTSATNGTAGDNFMQTTIALNTRLAITIPQYRITLAAPATVYLVGQAQFSGGGSTANANGRITATRVG